MLEQISLFDGNNEFKINKPIRLIELFGGIGSQAKALENLGANFEHYRLCEFDKYAVASYNAVHHTNFLTSDITKINAADLGIVDTEKYEYIMTYSFPCQDLSNAGLGKGMDKGSGTRSGLLWEVERLLNECTELPQILLMENVPQVHCKKNMDNFTKWISVLESKGYKNYWQDLNAKNYGIPQNRNRCFMVSILGDYNYIFPQGVELKLHLKDLLETEVDEKYYLSDSMLKYIVSEDDSYKVGQNNLNINRSVACSKTTREGNTRADTSDYIADGLPEDINLKHKLCNELIKNNLVEEGDVIRHSYTNSRLNGEKKDIKNQGVSPTLDTRCDCLGVVVNDSSRLRIKNGTKLGYLEAEVGDGIDLAYPDSKQRRGRVQKGMTQTVTTHDSLGVMVYDEQNKKIHVDGICNTIMCDGSSPNHNPRIIQKCGDWGTNKYSVFDMSDTIAANPMSDRQQLLVNNYRIRKLTPKECWRLMGFSDVDFDSAAALNSNAQLYKQAGNSIVVNVLMAIFKEML